MNLRENFKFLNLVIACTFLLPSIGLQAQKQKTKNMKKDKVVVEIWSDVVCPFCYIGKNELEKAIHKLNAEDQVEIVWHSYQLDPNFPKGQAITSTKYLSERKGIPLAQVEAMSSQLAQQGKEYDIDFKFDKALSFNTFDAHRLIQWAKTQNKSHELKTALMNAYFSQAINLSESDKLLQVVSAVGLDIKEAEELLKSDKFSDAVEEDIYQSRQLGIRGVPFFLINESASISGAQADQVFEASIAAAIKNLESQEKSANEGMCLPSGICE